MTKSFSDIQSLVAEMVENDKELRKFDEQVDAAVHLEWEVPEAVSRIEGFRKYVSTTPFDSISAATRTFAAVQPKLNVDPITIQKALDPELRDIDSDASRKKANAWERALSWALQQADKRVVTLIQDLIRSPLKYDRIALQVIYLPYQIKSIEASGGNAMRYKSMKRQGDFAVKVHHPKDVHTRHSVFGLEAVALTTICSPQEIIDTYGKSAAKLKRRMEDEDCEAEWVLIEYNDYETRAIWCIPGDDIERLASLDDSDPTKEEETIVILEPEEPKFPFLNGWVCVRGGTALDKVAEHQHMPLLYSMIRSKQWENVNLAGSIRHTDAIITAGKPRAITEGPNPSEGVNYSYDKLGGEVQVKTGHKFTPIPRDGGNPELEALYLNDVTDLNATAVSRTLITADSSPNEPFSSFDQRVKMAVASLIPFKKEAERALDELFTTMLLWIHYSKIDLNAYGKDDKTGNYQRYTIKAEDIDPECIYLQSEFISDQPIDRMQQINSATQAAQFLSLSKKTLLGFLDITDPLIRDITALLRGRVLKGDYCIIKFRNFDTKEVILYSIDVKSSISMLTTE